MGWRLNLFIIWLFAVLNIGSSQSTSQNAVFTSETVLFTSTSTKSTNTEQSFGPTGTLSDIPRTISPPNGVPTAPPNTRLFQIAFNGSLDYKLVLNHPMVQQDIFKYLPIGLANGLQISCENVTMQALQDYDTTATELGYATTLAAVWIPSNLVDTLRGHLADKNSSIYRNPDPSVNMIMSLLLPSVPSLAPTTSSRSPGSTGLTVVNTAASSPSPGPKGLSPALKFVIALLVPVSVIAPLILGVAHWREKKRKKLAISRRLASKERKIYKERKTKSLPGFFQQKPELDGEDQIHEIFTEGKWMELHEETSRRQELQGEERGMGLHSERRQEMQAEDSRHELMAEQVRYELPAEGWGRNHGSVALKYRIEARAAVEVL